MTSSDATTPRDRAIGALVGLAVGDAVGTTLEFKPPGSFTPIDDMVGGGPFGLEAGQWTDDTSMAMCLAESILDVGDLDPADQLRRYVAWWRDGYWSSNGRCFDIGGTTAGALSRFEDTGAVTDHDVDQERAANGSLMRLAPVPIRWHTDTGEAAERAGESSRTTHPASRPVDACRLHAAMTAALIQGRSIDEVLDPGFWQHGPLDPRVEAVARGSWRTKQPPDIRGSGYVVDALEAALWAVGGADDFRDAVLRAANLGDDADTTAAIAGQLAGARWGWCGDPRGLAAADHRRRTDRRDRRPALRPSAPGWSRHTPGRTTTFVHGYWVEPGQDPRRRVPGHARLGRAGARQGQPPGRPRHPHLRGPHHAPGRHGALRAPRRRRRGAASPRPATDPPPDPRHGHPARRRLRRDRGHDPDRTARGGVYVHCWGGIGRTGTVVGCLLVDDGLSADAALARLDELRSVTRKRRMPAPQTREQIEIIRRRGRTA